MSIPDQPADPADAARRIVRFELAPRTIFAIAGKEIGPSPAG
jgi:hypothetical protein